MKSMDALALALALLAALTPAGIQGQGLLATVEAPATAPRLKMEIAAEVFEQLGRLADSRKTETVRCLTGAYDGAKIIIDLAVEPKILEATENRVRYEACPRATIALWHNHRAIRGLQPEHSCYMSSVDIAAALQPGAPQIQIVQVRSDVLCWWTPLDLKSAEGAQVLLPRPSKRIGKPVNPSALDCRGPGRVLPICTSREQALVSERQ